MVARALMFMGTGSDVGKSLIVAGLCRAAVNRGLRVMPFKPQNMSNNAAVTVDGGEIGRAQALQARAAKQDPTTAMNPVLLKPEHESGAQVILRGKRVASMPARTYFAARQKYLAPVHQAFSELAQDADLLLVEGAGSASEINLRHNDIANFGFARAAKLPVALIGDIQRGGVIAALVGTFNVIAPEDAALIAATIINRFQGDPSLFESGKTSIAELTGVPCLGPIPHFAEAAELPAEDVLALDQAIAPKQGTKIKIAVPRLPRISNFDDLDPLRAEPAVELIITPPGQPLPRDAGLIILPGSKAPRADLDAIRQLGWDIDIKAHARAGGKILGLCGGYQMLGKSIADPDGLEGTPGVTEGLGLLDVETTLAPAKQLRLENGTDSQFGQILTGYHMHLGETRGPDRARPFAHIAETPEGATSPDGRIMGTYLHGLFAADAFRSKFIENLGAPASNYAHDPRVEQVLDMLAAHLETHLDVPALFDLAQPPTLI